MGWKGTIRSINAAAKRAEKYQRQVDKQNQIIRAHEAVDNFNNYLEGVVSFHKGCHSQKVNWEYLRDKSAPSQPIHTHHNEEAAKYNFEHYAAGFFIRLLKLENWMKKRLEKKISSAVGLDLKIYEAATERYNKEFSDWNSDKQMAEMVLAMNLEGYNRAIKKYDAFYNAGRFSKGVSLSFNEGVLDIEVDIQDITDVIPRESAKALKNGTISRKEIPMSKYHSMYQDFVCSALFRISRECLTLFPIEECVVNAKVLMLNKSSGHMEEQIILSIRIPRATTEKINFRKIDPSEALKNFVHNMEFKASSGFGSVEKISSNKKIA